MRGFGFWGADRTALIEIMQRIFGVAKAQPKAAAPYKGPTLSEAAEKMDGRVTDLDAKIKQCDEEIKKYLAQAKGPGAQTAKMRAMQALKRKKMYIEGGVRVSAV